MKFEVVGMHRDRRILEIDDDFHRFALGPRGEIEQRMLVEFQLRQHTFQPRSWLIGHLMILTGVVQMRSRCD